MPNVTTYEADCVRDGKFWVITVKGLPGNSTNVTQGFSRTEVRSMAIELISLVTGNPESEIAVNITWAIGT